MAAGRRVDFTQKEMEEMTGLGRVQFKRNLERVCAMYGIKVSDFKKERDNPNSHYTFPPEVAELLAILVKNYYFHPLTLAKKEKDNKIVKATDVANYNKKILEDIDELEDVFMKAVYCRPGHYVANNIAFWTDEFVKQLTRFIYNLSALKSENIGDALAQFTKQLDDMNYYLFRAEYFRNEVVASNEEVTPPEFRMTELDKSMNVQNKGIDYIIADIIKGFLPTVREIRKKKFPEYVPPYEFINNNPILGFKSVVVHEGEDTENEESADDLFLVRMLYYRQMIAGRLPSTSYELNKSNLEHLHEKNSQWRNRVDAIKNGSFKEPSELTLEEKKKNVRANIAERKAYIEEAEKVLAELENETEDSEKDLLLTEMQTSFEEHCLTVDKENKRLHEIVDKLVGEAMQEIMK